MAILIVVHDITWGGAVGRGGQTMLALHWLRGFERLGHRVIFVDFLDWDPRERGLPTVGRFAEVVSAWWHPDQTALLLRNSLESLYGLEAAQIAELAREAAAVITITVPGRREPPPLLENIRPRILVEQDPGYTHLWAVGLEREDIFGEHDLYFSVGGNVGSARCSIPTHGLRWRAIWNPVVIDWWPPPEEVARDRFTTIADWYSQGYLEFEGKTLGPKSEEFQKFIELPRRIGEPLEIALEIAPDDPDIFALERHGWKLVSPRLVHGPARYRGYVTGSLGEFSCAKGGYVGTQCGWFSDRSACYLAAGRPVVLQATGFADRLPAGRGLFSVATVEEASEAIRAIRKDYRLHSSAARAIALEHFDSDKVLGRLLTEAGIGNAGFASPGLPRKAI